VIAVSSDVSNLGDRDLSVIYTQVEADPERLKTLYENLNVLVMSDAGDDVRADLLAAVLTTVLGLEYEVRDTSGWDWPPRRAWVTHPLRRESATRVVRRWLEDNGHVNGGMSSGT
jgi:hypothetical protein